MSTVYDEQILLIKLVNVSGIQCNKSELDKFYAFERLGD